jgi:hypothetical protein
VSKAIYRFPTRLWPAFIQLDIINASSGVDALSVACALFTGFLRPPAVLRIAIAFSAAAA